MKSPSSRGRGLKCGIVNPSVDSVNVALFTRAWIEIENHKILADLGKVALFTRAWIEIFQILAFKSYILCRPLHEGVD